MIELYLIIFLCVIIALTVGFLAVTAYMGWVLIMKDLEKRKEADDGQTKSN